MLTVCHAERGFRDALGMFREECQKGDLGRKTRIARPVFLGKIRVEEVEVACSKGNRILEEEEEHLLLVPLGSLEVEVGYRQRKMPYQGVEETVALAAFPTCLGEEERVLGKVEANRQGEAAAQAVILTEGVAAQLVEVRSEVDLEVVVPLEKLWGVV